MEHWAHRIEETAERKGLQGGWEPDPAWGALFSPANLHTSAQSLEASTSVGSYAYSFLHVTGPYREFV